MQVPLQVTFRHLAPSETIESKVREKAAKLERFSEHVTRCHVVIEAPHRRHRQGKLYHVTVDVTLPGGELIVNREPQQHHAHEDVFVAIRDAFDATVRRLEDYTRRRRMDVKEHAEAPHGYVRTILAQAGYGFIETPDGREIYFHRNSVLDDGFDTLAPGQPVRFAEEQGEQGPQASSVYPLEKRPSSG